MPADERRKVIVVGDANCGKASLLSVFVHGCFPEVSTGMSFEECHTSLNVGNGEVYLTLWNTSGQEDYHNLRPVAYLDADVCIVCFSIGSHDSLESASERWAKEVRRACPHVPLILVGMKSDLRDNTEAGKKIPVLVSEAEGKAAASSIGAFAYIECSARLYQHVSDVFELAVMAANSKQKGRKSLIPTVPLITSPRTPRSHRRKEKIKSTDGLDAESLDELATFDRSGKNQQIAESKSLPIFSPIEETHF